MLPAKVLSFARLSRLDSSFLAAMVIFIPLWIGGVPWLDGVQAALPILSASMCSFILNDIHDAEKDALNHPERPIPLGLISKNTAMFYYFAGLFVTLVLIKAYIASEEIFLYLLFVVVVTNYNFIVERFPYLKNPYVAFATVIPVLIAQRLLMLDVLWSQLPLALFLFILGREALMDVLDAQGDGQTLANTIGIKTSTWLAFSLQGAGLLALFPASETVVQKMVFGIMLLLLFLFGVLWAFTGLRKIVIHMMKVQLAASIIYLVG